VGVIVSASLVPVVKNIPAKAVIARAAKIFDIVFMVGLLSFCA